MLARCISTQNDFKCGFKNQLNFVFIIFLENVFTNILTVYNILTYHLKFNFQLNPPQVMSEAVIYSKVSSEITSMIGQTTVFLFSTILANRGSNHPSVHSQWASKKVMTSPLTCLAPSNRALIRPDLFSVLQTNTGTGSVATYSSSWIPRWSANEKGKII